MGRNDLAVTTEFLKNEKGYNEMDGMGAGASRS